MTDSIQKIIQEYSNQLFEKVKAYRSHLHKYPELSFQEFETSNFVTKTLNELGIENHKIGNTGVIGYILGPKHSKEDTFIGIRADLDALPIQEENEVSYKSKNKGIMHACGHDVHTSILLGVAEILYTLKENLSQPIKLIFQPGEEKNPGGASILIKEGVLDSPIVSKMYALHVFPELETGKIGFKKNLYMASCDEIYVTIQGKGGHGAMPHTCVDPILIGSSVVTNLQQIISRKCDPTIPAVLSFGHFEGIGATNIIPSTVYLKGTFRTMDEKWREKAWGLIENQILAIAKSFGGSAEVFIDKGYPCLINDSELVDDLRQKMEVQIGKDNCIDLPIRMTSEDFAFYSQKIPVCFVRLGVRNEAKNITHSVHHPKFDIDENALKTGMQVLCNAAFNTLM
jgi:amidohydrolase